MVLEILLLAPWNGNIRHDNNNNYYYCNLIHVYYILCACRRHRGIRYALYCTAHCTGPFLASISLVCSRRVLKLYAGETLHWSKVSRSAIFAVKSTLRGPFHFSSFAALCFLFIPSPATSTRNKISSRRNHFSSALLKTIPPGRYAGYSTYSYNTFCSQLMSCLCNYGGVWGLWRLDTHLVGDREFLQDARKQLSLASSYLCASLVKTGCLFTSSKSTVVLGYLHMGHWFLHITSFNT